MSSSSITEGSPNKVVVNLLKLESLREQDRRISVWKVQQEPKRDIRLGQAILFYFSILGKRVGVDPSGRRVECDKKYEGVITSVVAWQKDWVQFGAEGSIPDGGFRLWVPLRWTALGWSLRLCHAFQRRRLTNDIPPIPMSTQIVERRHRQGLGQADRLRKVAGVGEGVTLPEVTHANWV
ncbi:hypothetical protein PILCRDRAFT_83827 [Piloderma croceum F 1598]|uniref:Uncharacterized protein n=1 Tax=Piloderma croceum (strain F 1598) TaxID=765440 RepID=A0A0C3BYV9_PILCF|nr:hypothetical protein PILCRDRAFT_83827 [Piloderma croceum F 1598]